METIVEERQKRRNTGEKTSRASHEKGEGNTTYEMGYVL